MNGKTKISRIELLGMRHFVPFPAPPSLLSGDFCTVSDSRASLFLENIQKILPKTKIWVDKAGSSGYNKQAVFFRELYLRLCWNW